MKLIIASFLLSAFTAIQVNPDEKISFREFFHMAYEKSFAGLNKMRDAKTGEWEFEQSVGDFDACVIRYDLEKGVHAIDLIRYFETERIAQQMMNRMDGQLPHSFPAEEFVRKEVQVQSGKSIQYVHNSVDPSVRAKNPEVSLNTTTRNGKAMMIITLFEPLQKTETK